MNLKTLYELKEVLDFCGYHDTIVEDMTNRGIDLESLEDKVNHEQKEIEENVYPNLHGTELLNKENISLLGEEILQYFEKTLEEWDKGIIDYDKNTNQLFHNEGKIFSSDVIAWYEGGRTTEDLVKEYSDEKEVEEDREHQILLLLGHAVHLGWNIKHDDEGIYFHKTAPNGLELGVHFDAVHEQESVEEFLDLFAKEKSQSIDKNLISFNSCTFEINLDSKDNGEGCLKWHNYFLTDIHNKDHFYIIQIVQETGKEEPRFSLEKFEKEEGSKLYLGEWVELEDVIKNSSEIEMVQNKLIELSDKEIGIQNEEIKNIEDDFEELDEVEK